MEADYKIYFTIFGYCLGERYSLNEETKYKHLYYFIGKVKEDLQPKVIFKL